jgi:hypothetical protein
MCMNGYSSFILRQPREPANPERFWGQLRQKIRLDTFNAPDGKFPAIACAYRWPAPSVCVRADPGPPFLFSRNLQIQGTISEIDDRVVAS